MDKWKEYLTHSEERYKPFKEAGFKIETVCNAVDSVFKRHSADIHTVKGVKGLVLETRGLLTAEELKLINILVQNSPWKDYIKVSFE